MFARRLIPGLAPVVAVVALSLSGTASAAAQQATEIQITHKGKKFEPAEISAPANAAIVLKVTNADGKAIEFESKSLKVEKVIAANSSAVINVKPQKAGKYEFFDEYNEKDARGSLTVK